MRIRNLFGKIKKSVYSNIERYIDSAAVEEKADASVNHESVQYSEDRPKVSYSEDLPRPHHTRLDEQFGEGFVSGLNKALENKALSFNESISQIIIEKGIADSEVYNRAMISRQLYNSIKNTEGYHPSKSTVMALLCALELDYSDCCKLMEKAGYAFTSDDRTDIIVRYCIEHRIYSIKDINEILFHFDLPLLGSR